METTEIFDEKQSLKLINDMINKTKQSFHETGFGPIMWGSVIVICSLFSLVQEHYNILRSYDIWLLTLVALVPQIIYNVYSRKNKQTKSYNDIAMDYTWFVFGVSMFILAFAINGIEHSIRSIIKSIPNRPNNISIKLFFSQTIPLYLMVYAIPTIITGGIMKFKPMLIGGILCWVFAITTCYTNIETDFLLMALAALFAWFIPGIILNIRYRKNKKANV